MLMDGRPNLRSVSVRRNETTRLLVSWGGAFQVTAAYVVPMLITRSETGGSGLGGTVGRQKTICYYHTNT